MTKTAFYGGSFDPPHYGHLGVALGALKSGRTDRILLAPAFSPPHKAGHQRAAFADRLEMTKLICAGHRGVEACDVEGRLKLTPSYTVKVLAALAKERPGEQIQLLIGGDSLRQFHTWFHAAEMVRDYEILTYPRRGETPSEEELRRHWPPEAARKLVSGIIEGDFFEISSTEIRNHVAKTVRPGNINGETREPVEEYIRENHLYQKEKAMENKHSLTPAELADFCVKCAEEKQAEDTVKIHVGASSSVADYYVIATANSDPQLRALVGFVEREARDKFALRPLSESGESSSGWVLIDFGTVIVHFMTQETRDRYNLEGLWGETPSPEAVRSLAEHHP